MKEQSRTRLQFGFAIATAAMLYVQAAHAGILASRPSTTDIIDWGQYGSPYTTIPNGSSFTSTGGETGKVSYASGDGQLRQQNSGWYGNFANGDNVNWTAYNGPLTLMFNESFSQVGAQIQADLYGNFTAGIAAYDGGTLLGSYMESGTSSSNADNSAIFIGVSDSTADITSVTFSITGSGDFAINQVSLVGGSAPTPTPEPGSLALLAAGLLGIGLARRFRSAAR